MVPRSMGTERKSHGRVAPCPTARLALAWRTDALAAALSL